MLGKKAKERISSEYKWTTIVNSYEDLLLNYSAEFGYTNKRVEGSVAV